MRLAASLALLALVTPQFANSQDAKSSNLDPLIGFISQSEDPQLQADVLQGIVAALKGVPKRPMPSGWEALEPKLLKSESASVQRHARTLAVKFGSQPALEAIRRIVLANNQPLTERRDALATLIAVSDTRLVEILLSLLEDSELRGQAIRGLARFQDLQIPPALVNLYPSLNLGEKRDVLNSLSGRVPFATKLLDAIESEIIPARDLTAALVRQIRNLENPALSERLQSVWGAFKDPDEDKLAEIARYRGIYRAGGSTPGKASAGRAVFVRTCQQCHSLFGMGGNIGPDITGSDRGNLTYLLQNIIDPNSVIPNEYQTSVIETDDDRVLTGIIIDQNASAITIRTANEEVTIPSQEVIDIQTSSLSMMPEGLLTALSDQEVRDLLYYLRQPAQAPLKASEENLNLFFNGVDLTGWDGNQDLWTVQDGVITGHSETGLKHNEFLTSQMILEDFRVTFDVRLTPNSENSGIQFRSRPQANGEVKGYQADAGQGWWGKLYEELGRGLLWDKPGDQHIKKGDWNHYEILAVGHHIKTAINGKPCVNLEDPDGDLQGMIALQLHSGGPMTVQFKNFQIELSPRTEQLKTVNP